MSSQLDDIQQDVRHTGTLHEGIHQDVQHMGVLYGDMQNDIQKILEVVTSTQVHVAKISAIQDDISELKTDMKTVKAAARDTNTDMSGHEKRLDRLETAVYSPS
jgi:DNA anti-recombination protein RmuC